MTKTLLHTGEDRLVVVSFDIDDAIGLESCLREGRRKQVSFSDAPEHLSLCAGSNPSAEKSRRSAVDRAISATSDFVQRSHCEAASRQPVIDVCNAKGQNRSSARSSSFDPFDRRAQRLYGSSTSHTDASTRVRILFSLIVAGVKGLSVPSSALFHFWRVDR